MWLRYFLLKTGSALLLADEVLLSVVLQLLIISIMVHLLPFFLIN